MDWRKWIDLFMLVCFSISLITGFLYSHQDLYDQATMNYTVAILLWLFIKEPWPDKNGS